MAGLNTFSTKITQNNWVFFFPTSRSTCSSEDSLLHCWAFSCTPQRTAHQGQALLRAPRGQQRSQEHCFVVWSHPSRKGWLHTHTWGTRKAEQGRAGAEHPRCHLLLGVMGRAGATSHLPCPACLVNTPWLRSLTDTALLCSYRHTTQPTPSTGDRAAFTNSSSHRGAVFRSQSDCYGPTDPALNKISNPFNFRFHFPTSSPQDQEQPTQCQAEAHALVFPFLPPIPLGLTEFFKAFSPLPSWIHSTLDMPESSSRRLWHHW